MNTPRDSRDPHAGMPVQSAGVPLAEARAAAILLHGRGARAEDILSLVGVLAAPGYAYLAPQAAGYTWYPNSFLAPLRQNEPRLSSALAAVDAVVARVAAAGIPPERTVLIGFSQGACLALEYAARHARRYGGVIALTGGLIGPDDAPRDYAGNLDGTPVFIGGDPADFHVPLARMEQSARILERLGGAVDLRTYPRLGHTINEDELAAARAILAGAAGPDMP